MFTVIRNYKGATTLATELTKHQSEVEKVIGAVPGFIAYYLIKTEGGTMSVTVCETREGCDETTKRAGEWLKQNLPDLKIEAPEVTKGDLAFRFANYKTTHA